MCFVGDFYDFDVSALSVVFIRRILTRPAAVPRNHIGYTRQFLEV